MKLCTYCKSKEPDNTTKCSKCGSHELTNLCNNCGTEFDTSYCPSCGNKAGEQARICPNCGEPSFDPFCSKCGTDLSGKGKAPQNPDSTIHASTYINIVSEEQEKVVPPPNYPPKRKKHTLLLLILLSPFYGGLILAIVLSIVQLVSMEDVITVSGEEGHPDYYGSIEEAKAFWEEYPSYIEYTTLDYLDSNSEDIILAANDSNSDTILGVRIDFTDLRDREQYTLHDFIALTCDYIPFDIIDKYYTFQESYTETSDSGDYVGYYYIMKLNKKGKKHADLYDGTFAFRIYHDDHHNWQIEISPESGKGKGYTKTEWKVDLNTYRNLKPFDVLKKSEPST